MLREGSWKKHTQKVWPLCHLWGYKSSWALLWESGRISNAVCLTVVESRIPKRYSQFPTSPPDWAKQSEAKSGAFWLSLPLGRGLLIGQYRSYCSSAETAGSLQLLTNKWAVSSLIGTLLSFQKKKIRRYGWFKTLRKTEVVVKNLRKCLCKDAERKVTVKAEISWIVPAPNCEICSEQRAHESVKCLNLKSWRWQLPSPCSQDS